MVAMNYALVENNGVILHVGWLNRNISRTFTSQRNCVRIRLQSVGGSTLPFLLSAYHLIGAYFLTTEGDKRMRLLTRVYGIVHVHVRVYM